MDKIILLFLSALILIFGCINFEPNTVQEKPALENETLKVEIVAQNLQIPWGLDFLPDGQIIFTERGGKVKIAGKGIVHEIKAVAHFGESGLQGIAVDPGFLENNFIYLYYTYSKESKLFNRISRFTLKNNSLENEKIILDEIPGNIFHDGGRIKFGPDGKIFATTGDAGQQELAQKTDSLAGKILRLNPDGSIPADNPFGNLVYSFGHRNSQGLAWHPQTGELLATEHGPKMHDEVNVIKKGENYGWPEKLCNQGEKKDEFAEALVCFDSWTVAPSGATFYSNDKLGLKNFFIYTGLRGQQLRVLKFENGKVLSDEKLLDGFGRIREVVEGPDGWLYFASNNTDGRGTPKLNDDKIYRIVAKKVA